MNEYEIRDLCAWLRLWVNNDDDPAFLRAVTTPKRGIGHQTLQQLGVFASKYKLSLFEALFSNSLSSTLAARAGRVVTMRGGAIVSDVRNEAPAR